jgi:hypothetical protein
MHNKTSSAADYAMIFILTADCITGIAAFTDAVKITAKVPAARPLTDITANCAHIAQLR